MTCYKELLPHQLLLDSLKVNETKETETVKSSVLKINTDLSFLL